MKRIFVIEDDDLMREVLTRSLSKHGYDVTGFRTAVQAVETIESTPPALIVSDVHMPGMTGLELTRRLRALEIDVPIILVTADASDELREEARTLGVSRVFGKPLGDMAALANAVACEVVPVEVSDEVQRLDQLRLGMLTELSHQLRTPITAMRLALGGLFDRLDEEMAPAQRRLVDITRRNVDRIVALVENQLSLLHATLGERVVARRLVDLDEVIASVVDGLSVEITGMETPTYAFTDPEILATVLGCVLCAAPEGERRSMHVTSGETMISFDISVVGGAPTESSGSTNFERRAYSALVDELGGMIEISDDGDVRNVHLELPLEPPFDRDKDFVNPVRTVKREVSSNGRLVSFLSCEVDIGPGEQVGLMDMVTRFRPLLSPGDSILRGHHEGLLYLALVDRSSAEIDALTARIGRRQGEAAGHRPLVSDASSVFAGA